MVTTNAASYTTPTTLSKGSPALRREAAHLGTLKNRPLYEAASRAGSRKRSVGHQGMICLQAAIPVVSPCQPRSGLHIC